MAKDEQEGCPGCGSLHAKRLSGPDERSADVDNLDVEASGSFRCLKCGDEYYVEEALPQKAVQLPRFSPTARCPRCKSYKTSTRATNPAKSERSHQCKVCYHIFLTAKADVE